MATAAADAAVRARYQDLLASWNRRDAAAYGTLFAEGAACIGFDGSQMHGPDEIASTLAAIFANHPTAAYVAKVREVRLLAPGVALLRAVAGMVPPGKGDIHPPVNAVQTLLAVQADGRWRIALFQNTPAAFHGRPELGAELTEELREVLRHSPRA